MRLSIDGDERLLQRVEQLEAAAKALSADNRALRDALADQNEFYRQIAGAIEPLDVPAPEIHGYHGSAATAVVAFSDWHIGEVVKAGEMGGANRYNWKVAQERATSITDRMIEHFGVQRNGYDIRECAVFVLGDMVTGDIHHELSVTNEFPVTEAIAKAGSLLGECFKRLCGAFERVNVYEVACDNHGRLTVKPQAKQGGINNYSRLVYEIANLHLSGVPHFHAEISDDMSPVWKVGIYYFAAAHGHQVKSAGRTPYYGFSRYVGQFLRDRLERKLPAIERFLFGHFHHHATLEDGITVLCPSLIGQNEWSRSMGLRGRPGQLAFLVGKRGAFGTTVFRV